MNSIGERIIFLRENMDMPQVKLAAKIGITKMTLYKYEKNICEPKGEIIARLADVLNTSADFILGRTADSAPVKTTDIEQKSKMRENELLKKFRNLNDVNKARIEERIEALSESQTRQ